MARDEAVLADEYGRKHSRVLREARREQHAVVDLLRVLAVYLYPAGIALRHAVRMVAVYVDGRAERAVHQAEDDRRAEGGGDGEYLMHQRHAVCRRGRHHAPAGDGSSHAGRDGGVFAFDGDIFGIDLAVGDEIGETHGDLGGGRYRIRRYDVGIYLPHRLGEGEVAGGHDLLFT